MARIFRVFSLAGAALGVVELYLEATWTRRLYESGEFELTAPVTPETLELLKPGNIVVRDPDDGDAGIIETLNMEWGDDGQMITAGGRMLAALLGRRVILDDTATEGDAESVMLALIANNCCAAGDRKIPGMSVPASQYRGEKVTVEAYGKNLLDKVQEIAEDNDLGFRVCWPSLAVEIVQGVDRTAGQSTNVRAIFSVSAETLNQMEYEHDDTDAANVCIVRYEPKETSAEVRTVGTQTGIERKEIFTTLKEADATTTVTVGEGGNGIITTTDWDASMDTAGALALAKNAAEDAVTGTAANIENLAYRADYDLGDLITVESEEWGIAQDARITEVSEGFSADGEAIEITFGRQKPLRKILRRE